MISFSKFNFHFYVINVIPSATWAVFTIKGSLNQKIHPIEMLMSKVISEWLPSSGYRKAMNYGLKCMGLVIRILMTILMNYGFLLKN
jgi:hypothetical protein